MGTIESEMVSYPFVVEPSMTIAEAETFMSQQNLRHLPVIDSFNKILGVISERDLKASKFPNLAVTSVMIKEVYIVPEEAKLESVVKVMADSKYGSVLIVNSSNELTGLFTSTDALYLLEKILKDQDNEQKDNITSLLNLIK